jgi:hypothetical protein
MTELDQLQMAVREGDQRKAVEWAWIIMQNCEYRHDAFARQMAREVIKADIALRAAG